MREQSLQDVYDALSSLIEPGATVAAIAATRTLPSLGYVVAAATENGLRSASLDQVAAVYRHLLIEATERLQDKPDSTERPSDTRAAQELLGLRPGHATDTPAARRARCADWLATTTAAAADKRGGKLNRYEKLIRRLAEVVFDAETSFQLEQTRQSMREHRRPAETLLGVDWVGRFEAYYRIWSPISGLEWDITLGLEALRRGKLQRFDRFAYQSLFFFARYRIEIECFVADHGGLWFFPSIQDEQAICDAPWKMSAATPIIQIEDARLSAAAASGDLVSFHAWLQEDGQDLLERWSEWLKSCPCKRPKGDGRRGCNVHKALRKARFFCDGVDRQWDNIADWYKTERVPSDIGPRAQRGWHEAPGTRER